MGKRSKRNTPKPAPPRVVAEDLPRVETADFDDPEALAARFALLTAAGAAPGRFRGVALPPVVRTGGVPGDCGWFLTWKHPEEE